MRAAMKKRDFLKLALAAAAVPAAAANAAGDAAGGAGEALPAPRKSGGGTLRAALAGRATSRDFAVGERDFSRRELAEILWTAYGVNRAGGKRVAPSAHDWRDITVYALLREGAFAYDAERHQLVRAAAGDIRALGGVQSFVANAPLTLVYVSDFAKLDGTAGDPAKDAVHREMAGFHAGSIAQNVGLLCALEGWRGGVRMFIDKPALAKALGLRSNQWIVAAQSLAPARE